MDLSKETNKEKLEAMAYREIRIIEHARTNLDALNTRIAQLDRIEQEKSAENTESQE